MFDLSGKSALVTGGARGIGKGISMALATQGADVAIADILIDEAKNTASEIEKMGRKALAIKCDVTKKAEVDQAVKQVLDSFGKIDILVNNVGWDKILFFAQTDEDFWNKVIDINYKSNLYFTRAVMDDMVKRNSGRIINIGSDAGRVGSLGESVYAGTKGAVIAFGKTIARELARNKITVNTVCPGPTDTPLVQAMQEEGGLAAKVMPAMKNIIPLGRLGKPEDLGAAVAFLASDEAEFITGQTLSVSGGLNMV
jgi:2-hydroxycyclohexanecarboxyl-CoA dehydrogenase